MLEFHDVVRLGTEEVAQKKVLSRRKPGKFEMRITRVAERCVQALNKHKSFHTFPLI